MFVRLLMEVVGVGLLLCVPVLVDQPLDIASWLLTCSLGLAVGLSTRSGLADRTGAKPRDILGSDPVELSVVNSWYVGGILVGQVFLCGFVGFALADAVGVGTASIMGIVVLALSGLLTVVRPRIKERTKRIRAVVTVLVALAWAWWPAAIGGSQSLVDSKAMLVTSLLFFVSIVGWEVRRSWTVAEVETGVRTLLLVFLVVAMFGAGLIWLRLARVGTPPPDGVAPILSVLVGLLGVSYCRTNLVAAATLAHEIRNVGGSMQLRLPRSTVAMIAPLAVLLTLAELNEWKIGYFLYGPASMTLFIFCWLAARVATNTAAARQARIVALAALGALLALSPTLRFSILFPVVVGALVFGWFAIARSSSAAGALHSRDPEQSNA